MGKYGISLALGRKYDLRFKLTPNQVAEIKERKSEGCTILSKVFDVSRATIYYYINDDYNRKIREKNRKHKHPQNNALKQRSRDLNRDKVREYTRIQMRAFRKK